MKNLLVSLMLLGSFSAFAEDISCIDRESITGLSDDAILVLTVAEFQQGLLTDAGRTDLDMQLKVGLRDYEGIFDVTDQYGIRVISSMDMGGLKPLGKINFRVENDFSTRFELKERNEKLSISAYDLNTAVYDADNPRYADIIFELAETDLLVFRQKIDERKLGIDSLRNAVLNGRNRTIIDFSNNRTKANVLLEIKCLSLND